MGVTNFFHPREGSCRRVTIDTVREFVVGVDLGKSVGSTVIAIVEYQCVGNGEFDVSPANYTTNLPSPKKDIARTLTCGNCSGSSCKRAMVKLFNTLLLSSTPSRYVVLN